MPYESLAQSRYVHWRANQGEPWAQKFVRDAQHGTGSLKGSAEACQTSDRETPEEDVNMMGRIGPPKSRGLMAREEQLHEVQKDAMPAHEAEGAMRGALGTMSARRMIGVAKRALKRQQQYAAGQYPRGY